MRRPVASIASHVLIALWERETLDDTMLEAKLDELRKDSEQKHAQNRRDIHELRNKQQEMLLGQHNLEVKLAPIFSQSAELVEKVDEMNATLQDMRVEWASHSGHAGGVWDFLTRVVPLLMTFCSLLVAIWAVMRK